jgi:uncharacterized membrane protein YedE/YeeE
MNLFEWLQRPWPWYVAGPLIGLTIPVLLLTGGKSLGVSSSLRHICAACIPAHIPYFKYQWKKEAWNLFFIGGITMGAFIVYLFFQNPLPVQINAELTKELNQYGVTDFSGQVPKDLFSWETIWSAKGILLTIVGGFFVGFGTRYAGGCTSGHSIMGLSMLQWPSLVATICFMAGGFIVANFLVPLILKL